MNNDGVQEAALASMEYYTDRPVEACDVRKMRRPYLEAMDKAFLSAEKKKQAKYRHIPYRTPLPATRSSSMPFLLEWMQRCLTAPSE
jgi:hypothetical protein